MITSQTQSDEEIVNYLDTILDDALRRLFAATASARQGLRQDDETPLTPWTSPTQFLTMHTAQSPIRPLGAEEVPSIAVQLAAARPMHLIHAPPGHRRTLSQPAQRIHTIGASSRPSPLQQQVSPERADMTPPVRPAPTARRHTRSSSMMTVDEYMKTQAEVQHNEAVIDDTNPEHWQEDWNGHRCPAGRHREDRGPAAFETFMQPFTHDMIGR